MVAARHKPFVSIGEAAAAVVARLGNHREKDIPMGEQPKSRRGFAAMSPEVRREIARKGGASVPGSKRSFSKDRDLASDAGRKGGEARHGPRTRIAAE